MKRIRSRSRVLEKLFVRMFFNHCNLSDSVGVWKCQERVNGHFVASPFSPHEQLSCVRRLKRRRYEGKGPCPVTNIISSLFHPTGVFETLGTISCVLRPVSPLSQLSCQMLIAADLISAFR
ncbi:hypothetical protein AVEN_61871-1 [Araneus ventricosus]|uniref:Uncharacterized protein n=1 Tax=Araneus ventricosus TaxID=182803 RepID=A0A4Y2HVU7_ARAVE|nr:hypothetical protein AVEN_1441-1 [Araneus ventricosus]GBM69696.1 hypothetical protein AVEN_61871-1 [Araneus ventricosus]